MKISIITITFNSAATIKHTLKSIANQSYKNIEHIIIDGKSSDETLAIVNEYSHVSKVISEPDKGIYDAMNKGIKLATGDIVGILNSDDFYANSSVVEDVMNTFYRNKTDSVYGNLDYVDKDNTDKIIRHWDAGTFKKSKFLNGWMPPHPSFFVKKEVYDKYGLFNLDLKSAADYELMLRVLYKNDISTYYIPKVLVKMREGGISNSSLKHRWRANQEDRKAWEINDLTPRPYTRLLKPLRKVSQFYKKNQ